MLWLITGVSRGIGRAIAERVLKDGDRITGVSRRVPEDLLREFPDRFRHVKADLSREEDIMRVVESVDEPFDFLVNNAGVLVRESYPDFRQDDFLFTLKVNTFAPLKLTAELDRRNLLKKGAKVLNTSSVMGSIALSSSSHSWSYSISKAALNMVTKLLSSQLSGKGIVVVSIHPGWVRTDMGGPAAPVLPEESADGIVSLARRITMKDSGKFFEYTGRELPW